MTSAVARFRAVNRLRPWMAVIAACIGILIAIEQDHVHLVLGQPATYADLYIHRCGIVLALSVGWAMVELVWIAIRRLSSVGVRAPYPR